MVHCMDGNGVVESADGGIEEPFDHDTEDNHCCNRLVAYHPCLVHMSSEVETCVELADSGSLCHPSSGIGFAFVILHSCLLSTELFVIVLASLLITLKKLQNFLVCYKNINQNLLYLISYNRVVQILYKNYCYTL